jgi:hypothetical protein
MILGTIPAVSGAWRWRSIYAILLAIRWPSAGMLDRAAVLFSTLSSVR